MKAIMLMSTLAVSLIGGATPSFAQATGFGPDYLIRRDTRSSVRPDRRSSVRSNTATPRVGPAPDAYMPRVPKFADVAQTLDACIALYHRPEFDV
jgi:hypothetical protein